METVLFLAKQGIAFRGHYENDGSKNKGNFLELVDFKAKDIGDLKKHIENSTFNYLSPEIQNEILDILANQLVRKLLPKSIYSIIMDETMDIGRDEQVAFCLRHVTDELVSHE